MQDATPGSVPRGVLHLVISGAPAPEGIPALVRLCQAAGWQVAVFATPAGLGFANVAGIEELTGAPLRSEYRVPGTGTRTDPADAVLACPLTFTSVNKLAQGIADNMAVSLLCEAVGYGVPVTVVPHCKPQLASHPVFSASITVLQAMGVRVLYDPDAPTSSACRRGQTSWQPFRRRHAVADGTGQRIARARRRRGLSQAVVAGLVGRSESWLSQVERGVRPVDSHAVLTRLAEVLRTDISELTSPDGGEGEQGMYEAAAIEQAMLDYSGAPADDAPGHAVSLDHLAGAARAAYAAYQAARYDEADRLLPALIREAEAAARAPGGTSPGACEARAVAYDVTAALLHRVGAVQPRHRAPLGYQPEDGRQPPVRRLRQAAGQRPNPTSGSYYDEGHWTAEGACSGLRRLVGASHRTMSTYLTTLRRHGLWLDGLAEPLPHPGWDPAHDAGRQPVFLVARCIKLPSADITQVRQSLVRKSAGVVDGFDGVAEVVADSASPSATG